MPCTCLALPVWLKHPSCPLIEFDHGKVGWRFTASEDPKDRLVAFSHCPFCGESLPRATAGLDTVPSPPPPTCSFCARPVGNGLAFSSGASALICVDCISALHASHQSGRQP